MRIQPFDNPFRGQLQLEELFKTAKQMKLEGCYSSNEYLRLVGSLTHDFMRLQQYESSITMRWDFENDPMGKVMMELTKEAFSNEQDMQTYP